ncbi:hypothetical protein C479_05148 [Halovivax asiaticus JCM 14624]|uniref:Uncharacterized protein n=1 Tax=Halovivax asiaticus JCM 14624 TaxID=1227490 RepID=M0BNV6_9EURY|nr:hypothetical protein C479_05148 [Halovivax asiaticus JCM 14624]
MQDRVDHARSSWVATAGHSTVRLETARLATSERPGRCVVRGADRDRTTYMRSAPSWGRDR